jgi:hypothetical protein
MASEQEMMSDLAAADAAGDSQLAQHIAGLIKEERAKGAEPQEFGIDYGAARGDIADTVKAAGRGALKALTLGHRTDAAVAGLLGDKDFGPGYREARALALKDDAGPAEKHPVAFRVGEAAPALAVPGAAYSTLGRALLTGGAVGAASAVSDEPSDDPAKLAKRAGKGLLTGAALGTAGVGAPAAAGAVSEGLENAAVAQGRRVLTGGGTPLNATKEPLAREAVLAALDTGAIGPLGTTKGAAERLSGTREALGQQYGKIIDALRMAGIEGPQADALAQKMLAEGRSISANSLTDAVPNLYKEKGESLLQKPRLPSGNLDLKQAEDMKRSLQREAKYGRYEDTPVNEAKQDLAAMLRKEIEDAIEQQVSGAAPSPAKRPYGSWRDMPPPDPNAPTNLQSERVAREIERMIREGELVPDAAAAQAPSVSAGDLAGPAANGRAEMQAIAAQFKPVKEQLGNVIEASNAANKGAGKAATSRAVSPTDTIVTAAKLAGGNLSGALETGVAHHFLRTRGASTVAWGAHQASEKLAWIATTDPQTLGKYGSVLASALQQGGKDALAANLYVIGQTDPEESDRLRKLVEGP